MAVSRKKFLTLAALGAASTAARPLLGAPAARPRTHGLNLGLASYTFRRFTLEQTIEAAKRLDLKMICLKDMHLPLQATTAQTREAARKVRDAGLDLYGGGVIYMGNETDARRAFEYAKTAGFRMIVGVPEHDLLPLVERLVRDYDIMLAIHNHGPNDKRYASAHDVIAKVKNLDRRIGLCMDIGHTIRINEDPSELAEKYADRLYDLHFKDMDAAAAHGRAVEAGRGVIDLPKFVRTLVKIGYQGSVSLEHEKDADDPLPGAAESIGYLRGILATL